MFIQNAKEFGQESTQTRQTKKYLIIKKHILKRSLPQKVQKNSDLLKKYHKKNAQKSTNAEPS